MFKATLLLLAMAAGATHAASLYESPSDGYGNQADTGFGGSSSSSSSSGGGYEGPSPSYGGHKKRVCKPTYDTVMDDHCEGYTERVCRTFQKESCQDVPDQNCRAMTTSRQTRKCFNVTELLCGLKEDVQYEVVQVGSTVQKCHKVQERVCDTVYETQHSTRDDFQCREISNPVCNNEERTIYDKTCKTTTHFECEMQQQGYAAPTPMPKGSFGGDSYGSGNNGGDSYGSGGDSYGSGNNGGDSYGSGNSGGDSYGSGSSYGGSSSKPVCKRKQETKCYKTPRTVNAQNCHTVTEKVCEKIPESVPFAQERQNCHNEEKKVCELEERSVPKQVKKYVYTKQCRSVPRRVCANSDVKSLVPSCVGTTYKKCHYSPVEQCEDIPKQHCFKTSRQVKKEKCDYVDVPATGGYGEPAQTSYGGGSEPAHTSYGGGSQSSQPSGY